MVDDGGGVGPIADAHATPAGDEPAAAAVDDALRFRAAQGHKGHTVVVQMSGSSEDKAHTLNVSGCSARRGAMSAKEMCESIASNLAPMAEASSISTLAAIRGNAPWLKDVRDIACKPREAHAGACA